MTEPEFTDIPQAIVDFEEARRYADVVSIANDLRYVLEVLGRLEHLLAAPGETDGLLAKSYWSSALITYVRCFSTGKRSSLKPDVFDGLSGPTHTALEVHNHFKDMRDKHVAHSVNPYEQTSVALMLAPEGSGKRQVEGVGVLTMQHVSATTEGVLSLTELAKVALRFVLAEGEQLQAEVLRIGESLDVEELYKNERMKLVVPPPEEAGKPRKSE